MTEPVLKGNETNIPIAPEFFVRDIVSSVRFYEGLGFDVIRREPDFAIVALGGAVVLLAKQESDEGALARWLASGPHGIGVNIRIFVQDAYAMLRRVTSSGATVWQEIADRDYGLRDFITADPDGYLLRFAAPIER